MKATVIFGANYGDEGKGLITDYIAERTGAEFVVRYNGGAQAGHTVVRDGNRHVFRHFGSGTLLGCKTFLARHFVCNPMLYIQELLELQALGLMPAVYVDPDCPVTTPYEMFENQYVETRRTFARHGSCGIGFHHTLARHEKIQLTAGDCNYPGVVATKLRAIRRIHEHSLSDNGYIAQADEFHDDFIRACEQFADESATRYLHSMRLGHDLVFEGAQGLLLSQDGMFDCSPHVTHSYTGLQNPTAICRELGIDKISALAVTRSYMTRHGAGPLPGELPREMVVEDYVDQTNVPNPWQGVMRYARLDYTGMLMRIHAHINQTLQTGEFEGGCAIAMTHCDVIEDRLGAQPFPFLRSYGPSAADVQIAEDRFTTESLRL